MALRFLDGMGYAANSYGFFAKFPVDYLQTGFIDQSMGVLEQGDISPVGDNGVCHTKIQWREYNICQSSLGSTSSWTTPGPGWEILSGSSHWFPYEGVNALTNPVVTFQQVLRYSDGWSCWYDNLSVTITATIQFVQSVPCEHIYVHEIHHRTGTAQPDYETHYHCFLVPRGYYCNTVFAADPNNPVEVLNYKDNWCVGVGTAYSGAAFKPPAIDRQKRNALMGFLRKPEFEFDPSTMGDLYQEAIQSMKYVDINSVAYLAELKDLVPEIKAAKDVISRPSDFRRWAKLYLAYRYGTRLTINDTKELMGITKLRELEKSWNKAYRTLRAMKNVPVKLSHPVEALALAEVHVKLYYQPYDHWINKCVTWLNKYDLLVNFKNAWDLIPYSFVVDWIVDVQSMCEALDARVMTDYVKIIATCSSVKFSTTCPPSFLGGRASGSSYQLSCYQRNVGSSIPISDLPQPKFSWGPGLQGHEAEASALVTQRIKY